MKVKIEILKDDEHYGESVFYYVTEDELDSHMSTLRLETRSKIVTEGIFNYHNRPLSTEALSPFDMVRGYPGNPRTICITDDKDFESYVKYLLNIRLSVVTHQLDENE